MATVEFPPAWVISLSGRPDRLEVFRDRAFDAGLHYREHIVDRCTEKRDGWGGSPESCGNAIAHHDLLATGLGPLMIFEDDAMLPPELGAYVDFALHAMPPAWELCLLGSGRAVTDTVIDTDWAATGFGPIKRFVLTHAYIVSGRGRAALAETAARASYHWDHAASRRMCGRGQVYGFVPPVVDQDLALGSDIP